MNIINLLISYLQNRAKIWNVKTTRIHALMGFANVDPEQVLYVMPNLNFPCVLTAHVHAPRSDENMKRVMEPPKAHAKQIFISVNPTGNVRNVLMIHSALGLAINVKITFVFAGMHPQHVTQLLAMNAKAVFACVVIIQPALINAKQQF